jgi:hypothetical protein
MRTRTAHFVQISISKRIVRVMLGCGYLAAFVAVPLAALWPAADVNEDVNAMIGAADRGDTATIAALLRGELAAVDRRDETGMTPLMAAARAGRTESCRELLAAGATINTSASFHGRFYATPLMLATTGGHHDVLRVLIAHGADVYAAGPTVAPPWRPHEWLTMRKQWRSSSLPAPVTGSVLRE